MISMVVVALVTSMVYQLVRQLFSNVYGDGRHIFCLRKLLEANGGTDPWDRACENCGRRIHGSHGYAETFAHTHDDGTQHVTRARFWHADRPACAAAFAADEEIRAAYTQGEQS
jgi:hypothetical protein